MTNPRSDKKSETLEIRLPYPTKAAFMHKAKAEGSSASQVLRTQIEAYLGGVATSPATTGRPLAGWLRRNARRLSLVLVATAGLGAVGFAISPAAARPDLAGAFHALDANGDGVIEMTEFVSPHRALATDIGNAGAEPTNGALIDVQTNGPRAYVRYMLDGGTAGGVIPLVIVVAGDTKVTDADISRLVGQAFTQLDSNGDGRLSPNEFGVR